jgi:hypothetical protein
MPSEKTYTISIYLFIIFPIGLGTDKVKNEENRVGISKSGMLAPFLRKCMLSCK